MEIEEAAFLIAIATSPEDDVAKLVYADWLADRDRAEESAWRWIAAFRRRPVSFRAFRIDSEPYWAAIPCSPLRDDEIPGGDGWINWNHTEEFNRLFPWPASAGMSVIPKELFRWLPRGNLFDDGYGGHRPFNSKTEAFDVLVKAFMRATEPRTSRWSRFWYGKAWVPQWELAAQTPNE